MYGRAMPQPPSAPRRVPPKHGRPIGLSALRAFDAAARTLSFTLAGDALALTQSAISRQIATLERQLGTALFVRRTRALVLTPAGISLHAAVTRALRDIDACVDDIRGAGRPPRVSLTTYASFASLWLVPRLAAFQRAQPQIEIRIDASDRLVDLDGEGIDIAVRRCLPSQVAGLAGVTALGEEYTTPALSPGLADRLGVALAVPADLLRLPLIELKDHRPGMEAAGWTRWLAHAGVAPSAPKAGRLTVGYLDQAVQAAVRAQGVVLGRAPLLDEAIAAGQLVEPFPALRLATGFRYHLMVLPGRARAPEVAALADWLVAEFAPGSLPAAARPVAPP